MAIYSSDFCINLKSMKAKSDLYAHMTPRNPSIKSRTEFGVNDRNFTKGQKVIVIKCMLRIWGHPSALKLDGPSALAKAKFLLARFADPSYNDTLEKL